MKRRLSLLLLLTLMLTASACGSDDAATDPDAIDVDLTLLSSTMVYAEVSNIMTKPREYMGKTIKINGPYYAVYYDETGLFYHYVVIEDATACCAQGMEFIWNGNHKFPDDYPKENDKIEITGVFGKYEELGETFYYLAVDEIILIK